MDAISRAIYWMGDPKRGVNDRSVAFIKEMNAGLHSLNPTAILVAEDSTNFLKVTAPVEYDGLGFDYKWDMGFMNDTLDYFRLKPVYRPANYDKLAFSMQYFYNELYLLVFHMMKLSMEKQRSSRKCGAIMSRNSRRQEPYMPILYPSGQETEFYGQ